MDDNTNATEQLPKSIGRFQVVSALGFGAMGAVYKAFDPLIKRTLAIKTIRLDIPRTSPQYKSFIERFYHEARISGTLSHPNIVTLFDIGEDGGLPYLAMEFIEGQTMASLLEAGHKFKPERVIALASQVASALDYAHGRGRHPPGHQALEPDPLRGRQGQGHGLRHRQARRLRDDAVGDAARDPVLHVARAGHGGQARRPQRHLLARRLLLRDALGRAALPRGQRHLDPLQARPRRPHRARQPRDERPRAAEVARGLRQGPRQEARGPLPDGDAPSCRTSSTASAPGFGGLGIAETIVVSASEAFGKGRGIGPDHHRGDAGLRRTSDSAAPGAAAGTPGGQVPSSS